MDLRSLRYFYAFAAVCVAGCNLDVSETIDATSNEHETITYRERFDAPAFAAVAKLGGTSAFGVNAAKQDGWTVTSSSVGGEYSLTLSKTMAQGEATAELIRLDRDSSQDAESKGVFFLGPTAFIGLPLVAAAPQAPILRTIPALLRPSETVSEKGRKDSSFQLANARVNAAAVNAVVTVTLVVRDAKREQRIPLDFANAATLPNGARVSSSEPLRLASIMAFWQAVGPYGRFDFEHYTPPLCSSQPKYRKSWMFGVGVYAQGAQIPTDIFEESVTLADTWIAAHPVKCP